ncbi:BphX family protein [Cnuibacter physcomitrellae]|uniref:BphX family protein n=1 Tax=Cnuibacter physcomitrellae TaxID=1619308 RepID=UPI002175A1E1|nr:BphX family protein [Cnuibacter physcomitrellae]MCS5497910.1 BphX family protein [Cnuibacter physcomitrellae]
MKSLAWWCRAVGVVYLVLGSTFIPAINTGRVEQLVPGFDGALDGPAWAGFVDYLFMFGLEELVLGAFLIAVSFVPRWFEPVVLLVCALSVVRGIGHDVYMISQGYSIVSNTIFIALHTAIIVTGLVFLRRARIRSGWLATLPSGPRSTSKGRQRA